MTQDLLREKLKGSESALLEGMLHLGGDFSQLKITMEDFKKDVAELAETTKKMGSNVGKLEVLIEKLYRMVAGDPEFHASGLIQKDEITQARITRVEDRLLKEINDLEKKHYRLRSTIRDWSIGGIVIAAISAILWSVCGDAIKESIFNKGATRGRSSITANQQVP